MRLYHATPKRNLMAIYQHGLNPVLSKGKRPLVWMHTLSKREWAIQHTATRHNVTCDEIVIVEIDIPRKDLQRFRRGLWTTRRKAYVKGVTQC